VIVAEDAVKSGVAWMQPVAVLLSSLVELNIAARPA